jgi:hypothetical protein
MPRRTSPKATTSDTAELIEALSPEASSELVNAVGSLRRAAHETKEAARYLPAGEVIDEWPFV